MKQNEEHFVEVKVKDKKKYLENYSPFADSADEFNNKVQCIHCGNEFILSEFKVVREMSRGKEYIVCKHYPDCNGSIIDLMPADEK